MQCLQALELYPIQNRMLGTALAHPRTAFVRRTKKGFSVVHQPNKSATSSMRWATSTIFRFLSIAVLRSLA
jgi:hypothetical protein